MTIKRPFTTLLALALLSTTCVWDNVDAAQYAQHKTPPTKQKSNSFEAKKATRVFSEVLDGVNAIYVDSFDMHSVTTRGINAMLSQLDPYTVYMDASDTEEFKMMTTGSYAGIGSYIFERDSAVYVQTPMPSSPAMKAGLRLGDKFVRIDGVEVLPATASKVSSLLRGTAGSKVTVQILRLGETKERTVVLTRANVVVDQVSHKAMYPGEIGYIRLDSFTNRSADDVFNAFKSLNETQPLKGLVLDLRGNTGGVMDDAIKILGMFVPKATKVLSTKGKLPTTSQEYYTTSTPVAPHLPLAVLIDENSASSSEIVAGALQDLDRAVILGTKSFGKGLVQSTRSLSTEGILKVTIARYYIPSGRCIQQLDYSHRNPDGSVAAVPDSLTNRFLTKGGREVRDGGGVRPDIEIKEELLPTVVVGLIRHGYIFEYANQLFLSKPQPKQIKDLVLSDADFDAFVCYVEQHPFEYGLTSLRSLERLQELAKYEGHLEYSKDQFAQLKQALTPSLSRDMRQHKKEIMRQLRNQWAAHYFGSVGQITISLEEDPTLIRALQVLAAPDEYRTILTSTK